MATQIHGFGPNGELSPGAEAALGGLGGGGVELVSGTVTLDETGSVVREFYCSGAATINGIEFQSGATVVWRRTPENTWGFIVVDAWTDLSATTTTTTTEATTTTTTTEATTTTTTTTGTPFPATLTGLYAWWDPSDTATISNDGTMNVADKSGNSRAVTQATASKQPATGTRTINGLNVLDFDGSDDALVRTVSPTVAQPFTVAIVMQLDTVPASNVMGFSATNVWAGYSRGTTQTWHLYAPTYLDSTVSADSSAHVHVAIFNGASSILRLDGTQIASGNAGTNVLSNIVIGGATATAALMDGLVAEVVVVEGALAGADLTGLEDYLAAKWGTP